MKVLSIIATSVLISGIAMTSAHAMGEDGKAGHTYILQMMDANSDGKISKDEFMKMEAKMASKKFAMMDMNDDGTISKEEFMFFQSNR